MTDKKDSDLHKKIESCETSDFSLKSILLKSTVIKETTENIKETKNESSKKIINSK